jgi:hypothetical protein
MTIGTGRLSSFSPSSFIVVGSLVVAGLAAVGAAPALAQGLNAVPFEFVGKTGECGEISPGVPYPAGSNIVTGSWLRGMGLPDNGGANSNPLNPADNPNKADPRFGLLVSKNGPTPDCSSSGARINGVKGTIVGTTFELGFDYRNGGHCGAGAPRFNVVVRPPTGPDTFHFVGGCANGTATVAPQDPSEWTRVRFGPAQEFPVIPVGSTVRSISILYDEGTDTANNDTQGVGLAVVDNIFIDGQVITLGPHGGE